MSTAGGYVLLLSKDRIALFTASAMLPDPSFAEAVPEFEHSRTTVLVCFICAAPGQITHLAQGARGLRAGTSQRRLNLTDIHTLKIPASADLLTKSVSRDVRRFVDRAFTEGGLLTEKSFAAVIDFLSSLSPELKELLARYSAGRRERIEQLSQEERWALASQKEAVNGALNIADIERRPLLEWTPAPRDRPRSFLEGLPNARVDEDQLIWHDQLQALPGFRQVRRSVTGVAQFRDGKVVLDVIVANRTALEQQTGADLIYFNATFRSFALVQYKVMEPYADGRNPGFRFPNRQLNEQLSRMDALLRRIGNKTSLSHRDHYRLNSGPFFLKLCPRIVLAPDSIGLTKGLYLPLDYWRQIEKDGDLSGPRGGSVVSYRNVRRHLDNTSFATVVRDAWVGTTPRQTNALGALVRRIMEEGRAAVIAVKMDEEEFKEKNLGQLL